jgi:hypothetical protein
LNPQRAILAPLKERSEAWEGAWSCRMSMSIMALSNSSPLIGFGRLRLITRKEFKIKREKGD